MEEATQNTNRYTIGKYLRNKKGLRNKDNNAKIVAPPETLQKYINYLTENGLIVNKLQYAEFKLKNGLPYSGLIATEKIFTEEIIVRVPRKLILSTKKAFFSDLHQIFIANPKFFSPVHSTLWEDHVLLVYLLYEYKKGPTAEWYHLINNLPRDLDYVVFWEDKEIQQLEDEIMTRLVKRKRKQYDYAESFVLQLSKNNPELLDPAVFTPSNIKWIFTHLTTRCFGWYFEYVVMVPFAELFNHECCDVFFNLEYYEKNPNRPADYIMPEAHEVPDKELEECVTSDGTYYSEDAEFDSDFEYEQDGLKVQGNKFQEDDKVGFDDSIFAGEIPSKGKKIETDLINKFDWLDGFSIFFVKEAYKEISAILTSYDSHKITINSAKNLIKALETSVSAFEKENRSFYKDIWNIEEKDIVIKQKQSQEDVKEDKKLGGPPEQGKENPFPDPEDWKDDTFDNFVMKASSRDQFEKGSQVFFCYGRLSNRLNLLRYGIALEYNKYEHVYVKVPYLKNLTDCLWLVEKVMEFKLSRYMRFKLKRTCVNINFINFWKGLVFSSKKYRCETLVYPRNIDLEIKGVERACDYLEEFLEKFEKSDNEYEKIICDPETGYHKYFAAVYCLEKLRLITFHIRALRVIKEILNRLKDGLTMNEAVGRVEELENEEEFKRNRVFLKKYLDKLKLYHSK